MAESWSWVPSARASKRAHRAVRSRSGGAPATVRDNVVRAATQTAAVTVQVEPHEQQQVDAVVQPAEVAGGVTGQVDGLRRHSENAQGRSYKITYAV